MKIAANVLALITGMGAALFCWPKYPEIYHTLVWVTIGILVVIQFEDCDY